MARLRVKEIAEGLGWNAAKLARRADLSNTAVYAIWNGETEDPGLRTLEAIARALGVKIRDLIDENGDPGGTINESTKTLDLAGALLRG